MIKLSKGYVACKSDWKSMAFVGREENEWTWTDWSGAHFFYGFQEAKEALAAVQIEGMRKEGYVTPATFWMEEAK